MNKGIEMTLADGLDVEKECYSRIIDTEDRIEALNAFKEKRKPNFEGI